MAQKIDPANLVSLDIFEESEPIKIDLVYAQANHSRNIFGEALYHSNARLWAHRDLAAITLLTARTLKQKYNWVLEIQDCLRTIDAQSAMQETDIVKAHPEWMEEPRLLAPPGKGGHPFGMAIDVGPLDQNGNKVDMGTPFDHMDEKSARNYKEFDQEILDNRQKLETAFMQSAKALEFPFLPLPAEWWDFRFPPDYTAQFEPLSDQNLPPQMQMTNTIDNDIADFDDDHFRGLADSILALIEPHDGNI